MRTQVGRDGLTWVQVAAAARHDEPQDSPHGLEGVGESLGLEVVQDATKHEGRDKHCKAWHEDCAAGTRTLVTQAKRLRMIWVRGAEEILAFLERSTASVRTLQPE